MAKYKETEKEEELRIKKEKKALEENSKINVAINYPLKGLNMIFNGEIKPELLPTNTFLRQVSSVLGRFKIFGSSKLSFYKIIKHLIEEKAEILDHITNYSYPSDGYYNRGYRQTEFNNEFISLLGTVCEYDLFFIRDITSWSKKSRNVNRQFREIINHLFVKKVVPEFMYSAFDNARTINTTHINWFVMMGAGESIKNEKTLPENFTKKMLHNFMNAPDDFTIPEALMYGRVLAFGGDERLTNILNQSAIRNLKMNDFWDSVIKFFTENPMLDSEYITQIVDFLNYEKYHLNPQLDADGRRIGPDRANQPNLTMKGRTVESLIRDSEEWHFFMALNQKRMAQEERIARARGYVSPSQQNLSWDPLRSINSFNKEEGSKEKNTFVIYSIVEILNSKGLREEGAAMSHCVGSYTNACVSGRSSIWSLRKKTNGFSERLITIEIDRPSLTIVQARGYKNCAPDKKEKLLIAEWSNRNGIKASRWI